MVTEIETLKVTPNTSATTVMRGSIYLLQPNTATVVTLLQLAAWRTKDTAITTFRITQLKRQLTTATAVTKG